MLGVSVAGVSRTAEKSTMSGCLQCCSLLYRQREGPAIWLKQEGIYILNMPWSWHGLPRHHFSVNSVESLIPWQTGRLIPRIWHITRPSSLLLLTCIFFFFFCTKLHLSFPHGARNPPVLVSSFLVCYVFSFTTVAFYSTLPCLLFVSLGTERLPWSTWTPWRACKYLYFIVHAPFIGAFLPCSCCSSHC